VELAQLQYLVQRIPVSEKQARFTGGIGMRGPGESPFQLRNAPMRRRIRDLKEKLEQIQDRRIRMQDRRPWPVVSIVGYTNAGKSTLLNAFAADADAYVDDRLFATLDTKTRRVRVAEGRDVMMADTVGFIRNLPHGLVASFRSTLAVAANADLLLIVVDTGHPRVDDHLAVVADTLREIGADQVTSLLLLNKCDTPAAQAALPGMMERHPGALTVSALQKNGLQQVKKAIDDALSGANAYRQPGGSDPTGA
jgi:GTP-binding protein HflX